MAGLNKVILIGNVGGDPEIRTLPSGSKVANFSLATTESYTDRAGQKQSQTEWHRIEIWEGLANVVEQYVKKGDPLYIEGKIRTEKWTDQNGVEKTGVRIRANSMQMLGGRSSGGNEYQASDSPPRNNESQTQTPVNEPVPEMNTSNDEDDLPF
jgi:single-strand DNA-binding protein